MQNFRKFDFLSHKAPLSSNLLRNWSCFLVKVNSNLRKLRFLRFLLRKKHKSGLCPRLCDLVFSFHTSKAPLSSSLILTADWEKDSQPTQPPWNLFPIYILNNLLISLKNLCYVTNCFTCWVLAAKIRSKKFSKNLHKLAFFILYKLKAFF